MRRLLDADEGTLGGTRPERVCGGSATEEDCSTMGFPWYRGSLFLTDRSLDPPPYDNPSRPLSSLLSHCVVYLSLLSL